MADSVKIRIDGDDSGFKDKLSGIGNVAKKGLGIAVKSIAAVGTGLAAAGGAAIKFGSEFEASAAKASTLFGGVAVDTDNLNKKILGLSNSTGVAATELNEALYSALSAGIPATENMSEAVGILEHSTKLAKAGFTDIDTALSATAKTLNAYGMSVDETERIQGILIQTQNKGITTVGELGASLAQVTPTAAAFGVSFENVGAALATMTAQGTPTAQATTQLNSLIAELGKNGTVAAKNLTDAAKGTKYAGMSFNEMMNSGASLSDVLALLDAKAKKSGVSMVDMFSSIEAGKSALSLMSEEGATFNSNLEAMCNTAGLVDEAYTKVSNTLQAQSARMIEGVKNLGIAIYEENNSIVANAAGFGADLIEQLTNAFNEGGLEGLIAAIGDVLAQVVTKIAQYAPDFIKAAVSLINSLLIGLQSGIPQIVAAAAEIVNSLLDSIPEMLPRIMDAVAELLESIMANLPSVVQKLSSAIPEIVTALVVKMAELAPELIKAGGDLLVSIVDDLPNIINNIVSRLPEIVTGIVTGLMHAQQQLAIAGVKLFVALIANLPEIMFQLLTAGPLIIQGIIEGILQEAQRLWNVGLELINTLIGGATQAAQGVGTAAGTWFSGIKDAAAIAINNTSQAFAYGWENIKIFFADVIPSLIADIGVWFDELPRKMGEALGYASGTVARWAVDLYENGTKSAKDCVTAVIEWFAELPENLWTWLTETINRIKEWGSETYQAGVNAATNCISAISNWFAQLPDKIWSWLSTALAKIREWGSNLLSWAQTTIPAVVENIRSYFAELPSKMLQVGKELIEGLWNGITSMGTWLKDKILDFGSGVIDGFKAAFDINSPSRVMRDEVGKMIPKGIAVGIDDGKTEVQKVMDEMNAELLDSEKKYIEESERLKESKSDSDKAYLEELKKISEKERKIYDALQKDIENDKKEIVSHLQEMADSAFDSIEKIENAQERLSSKLRSTGNTTYDTITIVVGEEKMSYTKLADMSADNDLLTQYNAALDELFGKHGGLPDDVINSLADMSAEEGLAYAKALLSASDEEYSNYINSLQEKQRLANEIGEKVYSKQTDELMEQFKKDWDKIPEDFFGIGSDSAEQYGEGFMQQLKDVLAQVRTEIANSLSGLQTSVQLATATVGTGGATTYQDNRSTTIYANDTSPHSIIEAQKQNEIYQQHTKKWE